MLLCGHHTTERVKGSTVAILIYVDDHKDPRVTSTDLEAAEAVARLYTRHGSTVDVVFHP